MKNDTKTLIAFLGLVAILPVIHEFLHYIPAYFLGMKPYFIWSAPAVGYWGGTWWTIIFAKHMPELVLSVVALAFTWTFRHNGYVLVLVFPLLLMAAWGFHGHLVA